MTGVYIMLGLMILAMLREIRNSSRGKPIGVTYEVWHDPHHDAVCGDWNVGIKLLHKKPWMNTWKFDIIHSLWKMPTNDEAATMADEYLKSRR